MANETKRYRVSVYVDIHVPDQGLGDKALVNERKDAEWFANEVCSQIPKAINKNFRFSERPYSVSDAYIGGVASTDNLDDLLKL